MIDLNELERKANAAEPGPYRIDENGDIISSGYIDLSTAKYFIAANPKTMLELIERVRLAETKLAILEKWEPFINAHGFTLYPKQAGEE